MAGESSPGEWTDRAVLEDSVVGAGQGWSRVIRSGQRLRIIDLQGRQAVDFLCYSARDPAEHYSAPNTIKAAGSAFIGQGTSLLSSLARPLFTVVRDTVGRHDTLGGCCSRPSNLLLYGEPGAGNCRDNLLAGLARFGLEPRDMVPNINWFMRVPIAADGSLSIVESESRSGDQVELLADMDSIAILSNCPQVLNPAAGFDPTPIRVIVSEPPGGD